MQPVPVPQNLHGGVAPVQYRQDLNTGRLVASAAAPAPGPHAPTQAIAREAILAQVQANRAAGRSFAPMPIGPQPYIPATHKAAAVAAARAPLGRPAPAPAPAIIPSAQVTHTNKRAF